MPHGTPLPGELVEEFVGKAHGDFDRVKILLAEHPALVNASWDWGGGDWEPALGAAAHMGRKEIALHLLEHGARIDVFAAAMLDRVEIVRAIADADPAARSYPGPHGIPLMVHAKAGGAARVIEYLESLG
jgi:hypothetical protein